MFLRNFLELLRFSTVWTNTSNNYTAQCMPTTIKDISGNNLQYLVGTNFNPAYFSYTQALNAFVTAARPFLQWTALVGTGTTEPTADDYVLESDVTSSFANVSTSVNYTTDEDGHFVATMTWAGTNTSGQDITITEIGARKPLYKSSTATVGVSDVTTTASQCLMIRHILQTPVTVEAGSGTSITIQIRMS